MPFAALGLVTSVAAPLISGAMAGSATSNAENAANAEQNAMFGYAKQVQQPFLDAGSGALTQQQNLLGLNGRDAANSAMSTFQASPGYQYQLQQGLSAVDNGAAAMGMGRSGNVLRAEQTLGNNLANQDFGNYYNRLQGLVTTGTGAANALTNAALGTGSGIAQTDTSAGAQQANIDANTGKAIGAGVGNALNNFGYQQQTGTGLFKPNGLFGAGTSSDPFSSAGTGAAAFG